MKVRQGFVSNSSSSSYVAVVCRKPWSYDPNKDEKFLRQEEVFNTLLMSLKLNNIEDEEDLYEIGFTDYDYGVYEHKDTGLHAHIEYEDVYWIGLNIEDLLLEDKKLSECKEHVVQIMNELGVEVTPDDLKLEVSSAGSG